MIIMIGEFYTDWDRVIDVHSAALDKVHESQRHDAATTVQHLLIAITLILLIALSFCCC